MSVTCCRVERDSFVMPQHPDWPKLRAGTQLDALYTRLQAHGKCFVNPSCPQDKPIVVAILDPMCVWSHIFWETCLALKDEINFHWYPVCVSADRSTHLSAAVLASDHGWEMMADLQENFGEKSRAGILAEEAQVTQEQRTIAWENSRIFRKAGGTSVPLAIFKCSDGTFHPIFAEDSITEIRRIVRL